LHSVLPRSHLKRYIGNGLYGLLLIAPFTCLWNGRTIPLAFCEFHRFESALARSFPQKNVVDGSAYPDTVLLGCPGFSF
jgi:hypothetical protein